MIKDIGSPNKDKEQLPDPRDYLSNERTYLSWIRTSIGIMAFGFVVVKFTIFVKQFAIILQKPLPEKDYATVMGIILVALGVAVSLIAYLQYRRIRKQLMNNNFKSSTHLSTLLSVSIILIGILLVAYLVFTI